MSTIVKQVRNKILRNLYEISFLQKQADLNYQAAIEKHFPHLPVLSTTDLTLVETIKREGVAVTSLEALSIPSTDKMFQAAKSLMPKIPGTISGDKNEYVVHATSGQMMEYPEIFLWGLERRLLSIAENYLGLPVAYHGAYFRRDTTNQIEKKSRLWHIDTEDRKLFKVIVYVNDINNDGGPFQYIPQDLTAKLVNSLNYTHGYIQEKVMQKVVSPSYWKSCTGSSGTVVFAATASVFHRGKIPINNDRFAIFFDYTSRQPKYPFYCKSSLAQEDLLLLAPQLHEYQRQCIFWRHNFENRG